MLGALAAVAIGSLTACGPIDPGGELVAAGGSSSGAVLPKALPRAAPRGHGRGTAQGGPFPPYTLTADSVLSEDYFNLAVQKIAPKDTLIAYARAGKPVEAMLLQDGKVSQLYRDPSAPGGWAIQGVVAAGVTDLTAGVDGGDTLHIWYRLGQQGDHCRHQAETSPLKWGATYDDLGSYAGAGPLQISIGWGMLLVTAMKSGSALTTTDAELFWSIQTGYELASGTGGGFEYYTAALPTMGYAATLHAPPPGSDFSSQVELTAWLPSASGSWLRSLGGPVISVHATVSFKKMNQSVNLVEGTDSSPIGAIEQNPPLPGAKTNVEAVEWARISSSGAHQYLSALIRTHDNRLLMVVSEADQSTDVNGALSPAWYPLEVPAWAADPATPTALSLDVSLHPMDGAGTSRLFELTDPVVLANGAVHVVRQLDQHDIGKTTGAPYFYPSLPLLDDVMTLATQPLPTPGDELLVARTDGSLAELVRDSTGTWRSHPITLSKTETFLTSTYRVNLKLTDDHGLAGAGRPLSITATSVALALVNGQSIILGPTATTVPTGPDGSVLLAIVADGLGTADLTIATADLPKDLVVHPNAKVNGYMNGGVQLGSIPALTATSLKSAPGCSGLDASTAGKVLTNLGNAATVGANPPKPGAPRRPSRRKPVVLGTPRTHLRKKVAVGDILTGLEDLVDDVVQGIKAGVNEVTSVWVDLATGKVTLTGLFGQFASSGLDFVIHGLEKAADVFHAVIVQIGATVTEFVHYLEAKIFQVLTDSVTLANTYNHLLHNFGPAMTTRLDVLMGTVDNDIDGLKVTLHAEIGKLKTAFQGKNLQQATTPPKAVLRRRRHLGADNTTPADAGNAGGTHQSWLLEKLHALMPEVKEDQQLPWDGAFDSAVTKMKADASSVVGDVTRAAGALYDAIRDLVEKPKDFLTAGVTEVLDAVEAAIDAVLDFLKLVVDTLLEMMEIAVSAINGLLDLHLNDIPLVGDLLRSAGAPELTVGFLACLLFAFPATVMDKIFNGADHKLLDGWVPPTGLATSGSGSKGGLRGQGDVWTEDRGRIGGWTFAIAGLLDGWAAWRASAQLDSSLLLDISDATAILLVAHCSFPSASKVPWDTFDTGTNAKNLGVASWIFGLLPVLGLFMKWKAISKYGENDPFPKWIADEVLPVFNAGAACLASVLGLVSGFINTEDNHAMNIIDGFVGLFLNVPFLISPALLPAAVKASDPPGASAQVAAVIDDVVAVVGGMLFGLTA